MSASVLTPSPVSALQGAGAVPIHVRKTITFDGGANNGNLGDDVSVFTITGRVHLEALAIYVSEALVCSAPTQVSLRIGTAGLAFDSDDGGWDITDGTGVYSNAAQLIGDAVSSILSGGQPYEVAGDIVLKVEDRGTGADITDGTLIIDAWYRPITDDGALA